MNLRQTARYRRRRLVRKLHLAYARYATWIPERFPDFMCIGAPRAATTWLHTSLQRHPNVFLPKRKEIHFYDEPPPAEYARGDLRWAERDVHDVESPAALRWYWLQYRAAGERLAGDITPLYSTLSVDRIRVIHSQIPELKVIYILRNPVERAWSGLRKSVWYQRGADFLDEKSEPWLLEQVMHPSVLERGNYPRAIERWESVFPATQIHYAFHDDIRADADRELDGVANFLGVSAAELPAAGGEKKQVNAAPPMSLPPSIRAALEAHYADQIYALEKRFDRNLSHWFKPRSEASPAG